MLLMASLILVPLAVIAGISVYLLRVGLPEGVEELRKPPKHLKLRWDDFLMDDWTRNDASALPAKDDHRA